MTSAPANDHQHKEEVANTITAGIGVVGALVGCFLLLKQTLANPNFHSGLAAAIYGFALLLVFVASALYHGLEESPKKHLFKTLDHAAIFLLIAGTYTPFALVVFEPAVGTPVLLVVWVTAVLGIALQFLKHGSSERTRNFLYLLLGWVVFLFGEKLTSQLSEPMFDWLLAGGAFFTGGTILYAFKRIMYYHAAWHVAVLCGCFCHFIAVWKYALA